MPLIPSPRPPLVSAHKTLQPIKTQRIQKTICVSCVVRCLLVTFDCKYKDYLQIWQHEEKFTPSRPQSAPNSPQRRRLVYNLRRTPHNVGGSSTICADFPATLAARPQSAPTSRQRGRLVHNLRRLPRNVGSSSTICADFPATLAARPLSAPTTCFFRNLEFR